MITFVSLVVTTSFTSLPGLFFVMLDTDNLPPKGLLFPPVTKIKPQFFILKINDLKAMLILNLTHLNIIVMKMFITIFIRNNLKVIELSLHCPRSIKQAQSNKLKLQK